MVGFRPTTPANRADLLEYRAYGRSVSYVSKSRETIGRTGSDDGTVNTVGNKRDISGQAISLKEVFDYGSPCPHSAVIRQNERSRTRSFGRLGSSRLLPTMTLRVRDWLREESHVAASRPT